MSTNNPAAGDRAIVNLTLLTLAVVAVGSGLFVYADRDGPGRTHDAIVAADYIEVSANVAGPLVTLAVVDNQRVKQGELLFALDDRPFVARASAARAAHEAAQARLVDAELLYQRLSTEGAAGQVASKQAVDDARSKRDADRADVAQTAAELQLATLDVEYCHVTAPFDGYVTNLETQVGEYVKPGDSLFALIDADSFHVVAYMKEQYLGPAVVGAQVEITLWQFPGETFHGMVQSLGRGIASRRSAAGLPVVAKTLDWVQLAARIPVRIEFATDRPLTLGATAHVRVVR